MSNVDFYTSETLISRIREQTKQEDIPESLRSSVETLRAHGVTTQTHGHGHAAPVVGAHGPAARITDILGKKQKKAAAMAANFRNGAATEKFSNRLDSQIAAKALKAQLHYGGSQSAKRAPDRLMTRSALCLAFAHGASAENLQKLRAYLDANRDPLARNFILGQLNRTQFDSNAFIDGLPKPGAPLLSKGDVTIRNSTESKKAARFVEKYKDELGVSQTNRAVQIFATVTNYCNTGYDDVNKDLRSGAIPSDATKKYVKTMNYALSQLPDWHGLVMRGVNLSKDIQSKYKVGETVIEKAFTSTSADRGFPEMNTQFIIVSKHGKNVSELSEQGGTKADGAEIVFSTDTPFKVLDKMEVAGITYIVMEEVG